MKGYQDPGAPVARELSSFGPDSYRRFSSCLLFPTAGFVGHPLFDNMNRRFLTFISSSCSWFGQARADTEKAIDGGATPLIVAAYKALAEVLWRILKV